MDVGISYIEIAEGAVAPSRVLLLKDGDIDWADMTGVMLDEASANVIIDEFKTHGVDLPIDYHHATTKTGDGMKAPAAGWIKSLVYEKGKGLFASVEWSQQAKNEIETQQYKYLSPVIYIDRASKAIVELDSVALTNKPRTRNMPALLEAAERRRTRYRMELSDMGKPKNKGDMRHPIGWIKVSADEVTPGVDVNVQDLPTDQVTQLDEVGSAISDLADAVRSAGGDLPDGADSLQTLAMAIDMIAGMDAAPAPAEMPDEVSDALGLDKKATVETACAEINKLKVAVGNTSTTAERLAKVEAELAERKKAEHAAKIDSLIEQQVEAGRLNPNDKDQIKAARALAEQSLDEFAKFCGSLPTIAEPGKIDFSTTGPKSSRERLIAESGKYWEDHPQERMGSSKRAWINNDLDLAREPMLEKAECDKIGVC